MKEALVSRDLTVNVVDSPIPSPGPDQVVIKVAVSGSNPKDWKRAVMSDKPMNTGDDIAGSIFQVGSNVTEFHPGDRVAAFHEMMAPHGSFAEYAVAEAYCTFHIPKKTSFEEASTIPLAAQTAAIGLYQNLGLPPPWHPALTPTPLIIYGAASAVGSYAIQLALQSHIHPLICVAGRGIPHVESLIDKTKGDVVLDYRLGETELVSQLKTVANKYADDHGGGIKHAFDAISEHGSYTHISQVLASDGSAAITLVLPGRDYSDIPSHIRQSVTYVGVAHRGADGEATAWQKKTGGATRTGNQEFAYLMFRYFGRGLQEGFFAGHPFEVVPGGLEGGVERGLRDLRAGKASAVKYVFRVGEE